MSESPTSTRSIKFLTRCRPSSATGREDYRLEEVPVPTPGTGRGPGPGRGGGHLRQRPEVLPRCREVLGRRRPAGLGRDRGDPGHEFVGEVVQLDDGPPPAGGSRSATA